jgi:response regulator RpfG family c-di-GMP phosphodiesterase
MPKFRNVLLVDDNEIDNFINERIILSSKFAEIVVVKNSADGALSYLKDLTGQDDKIPEFIFLDLNMPVKDGFGFLEDFNKLDDKIKNKSKVVVLSSSISPEDINKASTNPFVHKYINKPLSEKYLEAI